LNSFLPLLFNFTAYCIVLTITVSDCKTRACNCCFQ